MISVTGLHLQYRLWIAEMNADINVLRILDDYVEEAACSIKNTDTISSINIFKEQFLTIRKELDELRHEMHLIKMKLATFLKSSESFSQNPEEIINHKEMEDRYTLFRKKFTETIKEFQELENNSAE